MGVNNKVVEQLELMVGRYPQLSIVKDDIWKAYEILKQSYATGGKLLVAGNGGSAADAEHIVGELMKGFRKTRELNDEQKKRLVQVDIEMGEILADNLQITFPAIALDGHPALTTAYMNDCDPLLCFAQQVNGYGNVEDVFWGISTSGNSRNILYAAVTAKAKEMKVIGLTGEKESRLSKLADVCIKVPEVETYMIQELHLPVYHCLCLMLEERYFGKDKD